MGPGRRLWCSRSDRATDGGDEEGAVYARYVPSGHLVYACGRRAVRGGIFDLASRRSVGALSSCQGCRERRTHAIGPRPRPTWRPPTMARWSMSRRARRRRVHNSLGRPAGPGAATGGTPPHPTYSILACRPMGREWPWSPAIWRATSGSGISRAGRCTTSPSIRGADTPPVWTPDGQRCIPFPSRDTGNLFWKASDGTEASRAPAPTRRETNSRQRGLAGWDALLLRRPQLTWSAGVASAGRSPQARDAARAHDLRRAEWPALSPDGRWLAVPVGRVRPLRDLRAAVSRKRMGPLASFHVRRCRPHLGTRGHALVPQDLYLGPQHQGLMSVTVVSKDSRSWLHAPDAAVLWTLD